MEILPKLCLGSTHLESQSHPKVQKQEQSNLLGCGIRDSRISRGFANTLGCLSSSGMRAKLAMQHSSGGIFVVCIVLPVTDPSSMDILTAESLQWHHARRWGYNGFCWADENTPGVPGMVPLQKRAQQCASDKEQPFPKGVSPTHPGHLLWLPFVQRWPLQHPSAPSARHEQEMLVVLQVLPHEAAWLQPGGCCCSWLICQARSHRCGLARRWQGLGKPPASGRAKLLLGQLDRASRFLPTSGRARAAHNGTKPRLCQKTFPSPPAALCQAALTPAGPGQLALISSSQDWLLPTWKKMVKDAPPKIPNQGSCSQLPIKWMLLGHKQPEVFTFLLPPPL